MVSWSTSELMPAAEIDMRRMCELTPPMERMRATMEDMICLDTFLDPGLEFRRFRNLFGICNKCRLVMTRRVLMVHGCISGDVPEKKEFIDLTEDNE
jgi:hypothetical protein